MACLLIGWISMSITLVYAAILEKSILGVIVAIIGLFVGIRIITHKSEEEIEAMEQLALLKDHFKFILNQNRQKFKCSVVLFFIIESINSVFTTRVASE